MKGSARTYLTESFLTFKRSALFYSQPIKKRCRTDKLSSPARRRALARREAKFVRSALSYNKSRLGRNLPSPFLFIQSKAICAFLFLISFFVEHCLYLNRKTEEVYEAFRVCLIVGTAVLAERSNIVVVEGIGGGNACVDNVALVKL